MQNIDRDRSPISRRTILETNSEETNFILDLKLNSRDTKMSINYTELNIAKEIIPLYEGGSKNLSYFIQQCEKFINAYKNSNVGQEQCTHNILLFEICCAKLIGAARDTLVISNCTTWSQVKTELLRRFGDQRNETLLENDLITCYQLPSESYDQYYERVRARLQQLLEHVNLNEDDNNIKQYKLNMYKTRALNTFQAGLLEPHRSFVSYKNSNSLEDCLVHLRNYDNHKQQVNFLNFVRNKTPTKPHKNNFSDRIRHTPHHNHQTHTFTPTFQHSYRPQQPHIAPSGVRRPFAQSTNTSFPRGPVTINRPPTQNTSFGFNSNRNQILPKPTPMSVCTTNTTKLNQNPPYRPSNFGRNPNNIIVEELFNIEEPDEVNDERGLETEPVYADEESYHDESNENFQLDASTYSPLT